MRTFVAVALLAPLSGCTTVAADPARPAGADFQCNRAALTPFIGQVATADIAAQMLAASGARSVRWVPEGGVVTMDFRPDRLTIHLDGENKIEGALCT